MINKPPKGFEILTDGTTFTWRKIDTNLLSRSEYPTMERAINHAWDFYNNLLDDKKHEQKKWRKVE